MNKYIKISDDLVTTIHETKVGFLSIAMRKSIEATHYVGKANAFRVVAENYDDPYSLIRKKDITVSMCEAAGVSTKTRERINDQDIQKILNEFVKEFLIPQGQDYVNELISRYLLTQGDALGGRMRNIVGGLAGEKLTQNIISSLIVRNYKFSFFDKRVSSWIHGSKFSNDLSQFVKAIRWESSDVSRLLFYDLTVPVVGKNIDIVLFNNFDVDNTKPAEFKRFIRDESNYLLMGELKGGIDPAGADEHWKTANTALGRIRSAFSAVNHPVFTVFIGAAIEVAMAGELFNQCTSGELSNCANLTKSNQLQEVCDWIVTR